MDLLRAGDRGVVSEDIRHEQRRARALVHLHTRAALPLRLTDLAPPWFVWRILMGATNRNSQTTDGSRECPAPPSSVRAPKRAEN